MYIKYLLVCVAIICGCTKAHKPTVRFPEAETKNIIEAVLSCIGGTDITLENYFTQIKEGRYSEDRTFQELIHCAFEKAGYLYDNGRVHFEKFIPLFPKNGVNVANVLNECSNEDGKDSVETTFKFVKCFQDKSPVGVDFL